MCGVQEIIEEMRSRLIAAHVYDVFPLFPQPSHREIHDITFIVRNFPLGMAKGGESGIVCILYMPHGVPAQTEPSTILSRNFHRLPRSFAWE